MNGMGKQIILKFPEEKTITINARIDIDQYRHDQKEHIVKMLFSVVDASEMTQRNLGIPWGAYLRVKRGLRNSSITRREHKFKPMTQSQAVSIRMHRSSIKQETN